MSRWQFHNSPRVLRTAKLDNLVLIPGSQLPQKTTYQQLANRLPRGQVLIVLPRSEGAPRIALEKVARQLRSRGHQVVTTDSSRTAPNRL
jgi:hypothetical protein